MNRLTQQELKQILTYDKNTGLFVRKSSGKVLGTLGANGYLYISAGGKTHSAHKLAWLYEYGEYPEFVDHIDLNKLNNRIANLRLADRNKNAHNVGLTVRNTSGIKGIDYRKSRESYRASVVKEGKAYTKSFSVKNYGSHELALKEAENWLLGIRAALHGEFANDG